MREGELFWKFGHDEEREAESQQKVGEGEVEDEDVPGRPHLLVPQHGGHHHRVAHNCNLNMHLHFAAPSEPPLLSGDIQCSVINC